MKKISQSIVLFLAVLTVLFFGYYSFVGLVQLFILSVVFSILFTLILSIFSKKKRVLGKERIFSCIVGIFAFFGSFVLVFILFIQYNHFFPAHLSDITLSNGTQTVVFMQMSHIARPDFYTEKNQKLQQYALSGATILVEGVRGGTPENTERFYEKLSFRLTDTLYDGIAGFLGLTAQSHDVLFAGISPHSLVSVDVSVDDLVLMMATGASMSPAFSDGTILDFEKQIDLLEKTSSEREKSLYRMSILALLNSMIRTTNTMNLELFPPEISDAIITERNQAVVNYIHEHPQEMIVIPYGSLHFDGIFSLLKTSDKNWHIVDIENSTPYRF